MKVVKNVYKSIYSFNVVDTIKSGTEVFVLDRQDESVSRVSEMNALSFIEAVTYKGKDNRFDFWVVEEVEVKNEKEKTANEQ